MATCYVDNCNNEACSSVIIDGNDVYLCKECIQALSRDNTTHDDTPNANKDDIASLLVLVSNIAEDVRYIKDKLDTQEQENKSDKVGGSGKGFFKYGSSHEE